MLVGKDCEWHKGENLLTAEGAELRVERRRGCGGES